MRAGLLRHRLRIERPAGTRDAHGNPTTAWSVVASRWGGIEALAGRELLQARQIEARATHRIRIRYFAGLKPTDRFVWEDPRGTTRTFNIVHVANPDEISIDHVVLVEEAVPV